MQIYSNHSRVSCNLPSIIWLYGYLPGGNHFVRTSCMGTRRLFCCLSTFCAWVEDTEAFAAFNLWSELGGGSGGHLQASHIAACSQLEFMNARQDGPWSDSARCFLWGLEGRKEKLNSCSGFLRSFVSCWLFLVQQHLLSGLISTGSELQGRPALRHLTDSLFSHEDCRLNVSHPPPPTHTPPPTQHFLFLKVQVRDFIPPPKELNKQTHTKLHSAGVCPASKLAITAFFFLKKKKAQPFKMFQLSVAVIIE